MHHTLVYNASAATAGTTNFEATAAATDDVFSRRNGRFVFGADYRLMAAYVGGTSATRGRIRSSKFSAFGEHALYPVNRSLDPPANPQWNSYLPWGGVLLPQEEELIVETSNNLGMGTEQHNVLLQIVPSSWTNNLQRGIPMIRVRASQSITQVLDAWSVTTDLTFDANLRGGWWAVIGANVQSDDAVAFRLLFPRAPQSMGDRQLRPGGLIDNAIGNALAQTVMNGYNVWGTWGYFHTFEPVRVQTFGTVAGAETVQVFLDLAYMGEGDQTRYPLAA